MHGALSRNWYKITGAEARLSGRPRFGFLTAPTAPDSMSSKKASKGETTRKADASSVPGAEKQEPTKKVDPIDDEDVSSEEDEYESGSDGSEDSKGGRKRGGRKKSRKTGERALVNTKLQQYAKEYGLRAAKTGVFIEQWIQSNLRYFETDEATCFDGSSRDRDFETSTHGIQINYTFVHMKCGDVPVEQRKLIHRRLSAVVQDGVATSCQLCLNTNRKTLSHKILKPSLDMALQHMLGEPVHNPIEPIVVVKRKRSSMGKPEKKSASSLKKSAAAAASASSAPTKKRPAKKQKIEVTEEVIGL